MTSRLDRLLPDFSRVDGSEERLCRLVVHSRLRAYLRLDVVELHVTQDATSHRLPSSEMTGERFAQ